MVCQREESLLDSCPRNNKVKEITRSSTVHGLQGVPNYIKVISISHKLYPDHSYVMKFTAVTLQACDISQFLDKDKNDYDQKKVSIIISLL